MSGYAANIVTENGEQFIPASQRPDGTWRKARRVKEGYVPQEEVPLYESKGKQFMSKKQEPIVLPTGETAVRPIPGLFIIQDDKKKTQKKKTKSKIEEINKILESTKITNTASDKTKASKDKAENPASKAQPQETATDPAKKLKNLKKRLREVEALEEKIKGGALAKPEPEQLAKINRKNDLLVQIRELEKQVQ